MARTRRQPANPLDRFWVKVEKTDTCWVWTASKTGKGYGKFYIGAGRWALAYKWIFEHLNGPVPAGRLLMHKCHNKACVRLHPDHVVLGDQSENQRDDYVLGARRPAGRAVKGGRRTRGPE